MPSNDETFVCCLVLAPLLSSSGGNRRKGRAGVRRSDTVHHTATFGSCSSQCYTVGESEIHIGLGGLLNCLIVLPAQLRALGSIANL